MAIYPNSKGFGYAVFESATQPKDCGVVTVRPMSNTESLKRISDLLEFFNPDTVILQELKGKSSRKSNRVKRLLKKLSKKIQDTKISLEKFSREQVRDVFGEFKARSKYEIAHKIGEWLPQFKSKLPKYRKPWMAESYHQGAFDAMSLAITYYYLRD